MKSLPVDILKIDKMFVDGLPDDHSMVTAIILMARSLNLQLIAEGVEDEAQRAWLEQAGVNVAQGFLFARPVPRISLKNGICRTKILITKVKKVALVRVSSNF